MNAETENRFVEAIKVFAGLNTPADWSEMVLTLANGERVTYAGGGKWFKYPTGGEALEVAAESIIGVAWKRAVEAGKVDVLNVNEVNQSTGQVEVHHSDPGAAPLAHNPFADGTVGGDKD